MPNGGEWIGLKEANAALRRLPAFAKIDIQPEMDVTAFQVSQHAKQLARRRTGRLAAAITWMSRPRSVGAVVGVTDPLAFYWKFLEYGTVKMSATPMFRPAADAVRHDHQSRITRALSMAAAKMARSQ